MKIKSIQNGLTIVEFTVISVFTFLVLFSVVELGVYMYSMQVLNDMSRKAARLATVCKPDQASDIIQRLTANAPLDITSEDIIIKYSTNLDDAGKIAADLSSDDLNNILFVRASVDYDFKFIILPKGFVTMPSFETILPIESLGISSSSTCTYPL